MTLDEIDRCLEKMAEEAAATGDDGLLPGAISMSVDTRAKLGSQGAPIGCTNILHGIRYRGVQVLVARAREDKVLNRAEDDGAGAPYFDLAPRQ